MKKLIYTQPQTEVVALQTAMGVMLLDSGTAPSPGKSRYSAAPLV